jgi:5-methylcytosine-specific restriction endonuclease McrA
MTRRIGRMSGAVRGRLLQAKRQDWRWKRFKEQKGRCAYCPTEMLLEVTSPRDQYRLCTLDHKLPLGRGGMDHWENSAAACYACNQAKGNLTATEFRARLRAASEPKAEAS